MSVIQGVSFINLFCAAISAGGLVMVFMVIAPILRKWPDNMSVPLHQAVDRLPDNYMRPSTAISGVAAITLLILNPDFQKAATIFTLVGLLGTLGIAFTSEFFNIPVNRIVRTWTVDTVPADYPQLRRRWDRYNATRTISSVVALICYIIAALSR
jgi:uncharacterized membrane protein